MIPAMRWFLAVSLAACAAPRTDGLERERSDLLRGLVARALQALDLDEQLAATSVKLAKRLERDRLAALPKPRFDRLALFPNEM